MYCYARVQCFSLKYSQKNWPDRVEACKCCFGNKDGQPPYGQRPPYPTVRLPCCGDCVLGINDIRPTPKNPAHFLTGKKSTAHLAVVTAILITV